jgi:hypothetical protein
MLNNVMNIVLTILYIYLTFEGGSKFANGGPYLLGDLDPGGPYLLEDLDWEVHIY